MSATALNTGIGSSNHINTPSDIGSPAITIMANYETGAVCMTCGTSSNSPGVPLLQCGACKTAYYCGKACQTKDWPFHKIYCKAWQPRQPDEPNPGPFKPDPNVPVPTTWNLIGLLPMHDEKGHVHAIGRPGLFSRSFEGL